MALVLSVDSDLRSWEVEEIIKRTAADLGPGGRDPEFGFGRIDCRRALEAASNMWVSISVVPEFIGTGQECFMRLNLQITNPGINTIRVDGLRSHPTIRRGRPRSTASSIWATRATCLRRTPHKTSS